MYKPPKGKHVAGIIPLSGRDSVLNFPWPDYLTPRDKGYLAVERAVTEFWSLRDTTVTSFSSLEVAKRHAKARRAEIS